MKTLRRFYFAKYVAAKALGADDDALASVWKGKWKALPVTALPTDFPSRDLLAAKGLTGVEDLNGANLSELMCLGLSKALAEKIIAALVPLTT